MEIRHVRALISIKAFSERRPCLEDEKIVTKVFSE